MKRSIDFEKDFYALRFLVTPRSKHPEKEDRIAYYGTIVNPAKYKDDVLLSMPYSAALLQDYTWRAAEDMSGCSVDEKFNLVPNVRMRNELWLDRAGRIFSTYMEYDAMMKKYGDSFTEEQRLRAEAIGAKLYAATPGTLAADFTYPDTKGKSVSLSDFKGKPVLVDVWATWCGPCRGELPYLKKLEEEMEGTDLVVIGVSVDEEKDKQKWLDFIEKEELPGIQLFANGWSKITNDYKINGIPRFMLFDREGKS